MKRLLYFTFAAVVALGAFSCARNAETNVPQGGRELTVRVDLDEQTRIAFNGGKYAWEGDEVLGAYVMSSIPTVNAETAVAVRDGAGYCSLTATFAEGDRFYAYFPYSRDNAQNMPRVVNLEIPDQQIQLKAGEFNMENMPMVAMPVALSAGAQEQAVTMYALGGFLRVNVFSSSKYAGEHVQSVSFETTDTAVAGSFSFDMTAVTGVDALTIAGYASLSAETDLETAYTVGSAIDKSNGIYIVLAPGTYSGKLSITTDKAVYVCNYTKQIKRNTYYDVNVDLDNAVRQAEIEPIEATLTYAEVAGAGISLAYDSPKTYTNSFGDWIVCAYDYNKSAFQLNSRRKVSYIGTPEFAGEITEILINTSESYTGNIYICTSTDESTAVVKQKGGGDTTQIELADQKVKQVYIRSDAACRISDITVFCGGGAGPIKPSAPKFVDLTASVEGASSATAADGKATLSADIDYNTQLLSIVKSGIAYKLSTASAFVERDCGVSAEPEIAVTGLTAGTYIYYAYAHMSDGNTYKSDETEFIIRDKSVAPTNDYKYRWFELPVQHDKDNNGIDDVNADYYYSHTFRADATKIRNFSACYSKSMIHPVWVAAPMHKCYLGDSGRHDSYRSDPNIKCTQNGRFTGYTRGHMIGSSDRTVSIPTNKQVFYYSNIGAQSGGGFNTGGGVWNNLENTVDTYLCADTLYQVVGCVFKTWTDRYGETATPRTASGSQIPTAWYKVLLRTKKGNTGKAVDQCSADELQCVAFVVVHSDNNKGRKPSAKDMYTVSEMEKLTGLTFFPNVPNAPKDTYKASDWNL